MKNIASIDVGLKRIGLALLLENIIIPQPAIMRKNRKQASIQISMFLKKWDINTLVVGLPKDGNDSEEMQRRIEHFISLIDFQGEIIYIDENGTSKEAKEKTNGIFRHKKDGKIDSIAAGFILERYLEILKKH